MPNIYVLNDDKSLKCTQTATNYVGEKNAELVCILIPYNFNNLDVAKMRVKIHFENGYKQVLSPIRELYHNYLIYQFPIDGSITRKSGTIKFYLELQNTNINLQTSEANIEITER